jgi:U3 small nucleolar RNA-associated protein 10
LFSNNALPSKALRLNGGGDHSVSAASTQLERSLATKVNIRQLVPVLSQSLSKNLSDGDMNREDACSIINVMHIAVESAPRSQLTPVIGKIIRGLVIAYGYEGEDICRAEMLQQANKCLLSLVMKLSEAQLRPLYARLRNWRGDIEEESKTETSSVRRFAFWSLSAELSKSLRSIFLPCLTSVLADVFDELELAVASLCKSSKKEGGSKRRRVEEASTTAEDIEKVKPLQPLLMCLTSAFKADAHEGGDWTRGDDNQRYNIILSHLGKLLLAQVPQDLPLLSDLTPNERASTSAYRQLVLGMGTLEHGNVVGCITALAAAAGNEQLWKPLNFSVLEACGNKRSEVRRAGVGCLLSLIDTIGEEYMVLLPECLPVLSELLEDEEEIASLAKQCVQQGEELLGESLEESLR